MEKTIKKLLKNKWKNLNNESLKKSASENMPGVYILAWSNKELEDQCPRIKDIFYVGMSNSKGGVKARLKQFLLGIKKGTSHSAGMRFRKDYCENKPYSELQSNKKFYYICHCKKCNVVKQRRTPKDLKIMGEIARLEYYLLSFIKSKTEKEPILNKK